MFKDTVLSWSSSPPVIGTAAFVFAAAFQSRSAIIGLGIAMAISGALPAASALPVALGAQLGSSLYAIASAFGGRLSARRLGFCSSVYYLTGTAAFALLIPFVHRLLSGAASIQSGLVCGQILIALFNIAIVLPFSSSLSAVSTACHGLRENWSSPCI